MAGIVVRTFSLPKSKPRKKFTKISLNRSRKRNIIIVRTIASIKKIGEYYEQ